ncbi:MAG TPA: Smr/MutS family protein [Syntrophorhabdaceae bacterium]|jgi:DNA-nicking Smr family endonuclease
MKKDESIYRLLSGLPRIREPEPPEVHTPKQTEPDDAALFHEEMKTVRIIGKKKDRVIPKSGKAHNPRPSSHDLSRQLRKALEETPFCVPNLPEYMEGRGEDANPLVMEKLRSGEFSVQKILDLHGYSVEDASVLFSDFIKDAVSSGLNCVKIIHGRGLKSKTGPVLKEKLKEWIVRAIHRKWVVAFSSPKMSEGGPGATVILLRRIPEKKKIRIAG